MIACLGGRGLVARRVLVTSRSVSLCTRWPAPLAFDFRCEAVVSRRAPSVVFLVSQDSG